MNPIRVAMLGPFPDDPDCISGGVEAVIRNLAAALADLGETQVHILTCTAGAVAGTRMTWKGVTIHYLPGQRRLGNLTTGILDRRRMRRRLKELQPHIVHAHGSGACALAALESPYPAIITLHGMRTKEERLFQGLKAIVRMATVGRAERTVLRRARHLFVIAKYVGDSIAGLTRARLYPSQNPVDGAFFQRPSSDLGETVLSVATIQRRKGQLHLVEAFARVQGEFPNSRLHLIGKTIEQDYADELRRTVEAHRLNGSVRLFGHVPDDVAAAEFGACSLFALCSVEESSPVSIAEAMALGKPVIATRVGGVPELVEDGVTGYLTDYGDVDAIAAALRRLLGDTALRQKMGSAARARADRDFRPDSAARRAVEVYRRVIAEEGAHP